MKCEAVDQTGICEGIEVGARLGPRIRDYCAKSSRRELGFLALYVGWIALLWPGDQRLVTLVLVGFAFGCCIRDFTWVRLLDRKPMKNILLILLPLVLAGCAGPKASPRSYTIAGGEVVQLQVAPGGALPSQTKNTKVEVAGFMIDGDKAEITYVFGFTSQSGKPLQRVTVEDVTGRTAVPLVDDRSPALDSRYWKGFSTPSKAGGDTLAWLQVSGNTEKVFRFIITFTDGQTETIHQASVWSGQAKSLIKKALKM
jgi:hypothetical protein